MNKHFFNATFAAGALALVWVASGFLGNHVLALAVTLVIAAVYGFGAWELRKFRQATGSLTTALEMLPAGLTELGAWLQSMHPSLRNPVRLRIEGERVGLPGPALTPYLVGLLVMLGMLGTFLGMVVTLNGAVFALEGTSDLQAIRSAFAAPIKGLGLAFGTSVAGVATSAMLGLMAAMCRRERMQASQLLDTQIATRLRSFSHAHQRQETLSALALQSQALPQVVDQLQALMQQMERMGQQMNTQLLDKQASFHSHIAGVYTGLAQSVDQSLRESLAHSTRAATESLTPVVQAALDGIAQEARHMHERMVAVTQTQLDGLSTRFNASAATVADAWTKALHTHEQGSAGMLAGLGQSLEAFNATFEQRSTALLGEVNQAYAALQAQHSASDRLRLDAWTGSLQTASEQAQSSQRNTLAEITRLMAASEELVRTRIATEAQWTTQQGERMEQLATLLRTELGALRDAEAARGSAAVERLGDLQTAVTSHLATLGTALEAPIARLIETASEAPRAAAEVIGTLRQEVSNSAARDNELLEERSRILETLHGLLASINAASVEQRGVIASLVASSAVALQDTSTQFAGKVDAEAAKLADIAANVTSSAVEVSTLGETFSLAVRDFGESSQKMIASLQRIEGAMDKSMARSDDQLAYYVAQAREVIDLSIMSQKEVVEALRQLPARQAALASEAA